MQWQANFYYGEMLISQLGRHVNDYLGRVKFTSDQSPTVAIINLDKQWRKLMNYLL